LQEETYVQGALFGGNFWWLVGKENRSRYGHFGWVVLDTKIETTTITKQGAMPGGKGETPWKGRGTEIFGGAAVFWGPQD